MASRFLDSRQERDGPSGPSLYRDAGGLSRVQAAWCPLGQPFTAGRRRSQGLSARFNGLPSVERKSYGALLLAQYTGETTGEA